MIARREFESLKEQRPNFYSICQKILSKGRVEVFISAFTLHYIHLIAKRRANKAEIKS